MSHYAYSPVGYIYCADNYCLDCTPSVAAKPNEYGLDPQGKRVVVKRNGGTGWSGQGRNGGNGKPGNSCNCTECRLDRMAKVRGIDRYDERSFDSSDFPKAIPYHNDLHAECGPEGYGYDPEDPEVADKAYCDATCAKCHEVIDGMSRLDGPDECPVFVQRKEEAEERRVDAEFDAEMRERATRMLEEKHGMPHLSGESDSRGGEL